MRSKYIIKIILVIVLAFFSLSSPIGNKNELLNILDDKIKVLEKINSLNKNDLIAKRIKTTKDEIKHLIGLVEKETKNNLHTHGGGATNLLNTNTSIKSFNKVGLITTKIKWLDFLGNIQYIFVIRSVQKSELYHSIALRSLVRKNFFNNREIKKIIEIENEKLALFMLLEVAFEYDDMVMLVSLSEQFIRQKQL